MNKETEQLKKMFKETGFYPYLEGIGVERGVWNWIEKALTNQTTTLKNKVEGMFKANRDCESDEHYIEISGHNSAIQDVLDILKELK